jgi:hypothetical protein
MREELPERPDPALEADLVSRMAATARAEHATASSVPARRPGRRTAGLRRLALPARIALATVGLVLGTAGLAVAGVGLPGPLDSAFKGVGIDLPNQGSSTHAEPTTAPGEAQPARGGGSDGSTDQGKPGSQPKHQNHGKGNPGHGSSGNGNGNANGNANANANANGKGSASPGKSENAPVQVKGHGQRATPPSQSNGKTKAHPPTQVPPVKPDKSEKDGLNRQ